MWWAGNESFSLGKNSWRHEKSAQSQMRETTNKMLSLSFVKTCKLLYKHKKMQHPQKLPSGGQWTRNKICRVCIVGGEKEVIFNSCNQTSFSSRPISPVQLPPLRPTLVCIRVRRRKLNFRTRTLDKRVTIGAEAMHCHTKDGSICELFVENFRFWQFFFSF